MRKYLLLGAMAFWAGACSEAPRQETQDQLFARVDAEIKENSEAYANLEEAINTIGHRLTGTENGARAEEYTYNKFKSYGFEDVQYQTFEVEAWARDSVSMTLDGSPVPVVALGHSPVKANVTAGVVDMGNGLEADYAARPDAVKDKIALVYINILKGSPAGLSNLHRSEKTALAIQYGAKGIIIINQVPKGVLLTGTASVTGALIPIPAVCVGLEDGMALKERLEREKVTAHIQMTNKSEVIKARNVVATLPGSALPQEHVVIGGHLDSWDLATGAIDNGIGAFAILDIARAFKANGLRPKRTVKFIMFMGEEQGLLGSRHLVQQAKEQNTLGQVKFMMNLDMAGNPKGMNVAGSGVHAPFFKELGAAIQQRDPAYENGFSQRVGLHSDHQPFLLEGIPILSVQSNLDPAIYGCYHSDCDDFHLVNQDHLLNTARFGTMMLHGLANADSLPAITMDSGATKQFMIDKGLKEKLVIGGDWKWED
ncbi:M20/M25/M40 family metallo-hydrolase [Maribacter sp. 2307ULW6-5]|uniref:M20/M25/M40 family metallo-hydrolase n=1 Tax=Maribacter sp. 2307ULW6-5 TaxID=3386275 RepID=UPI0039BC8ED6